jgi:hypothetical protein
MVINKQNINDMKTFNELTTGTIVTYNDMANVNIECVILDTIKNDFGTFVNIMNLETKNIEPMTATTEIGKRWTL